MNNWIGLVLVGLWLYIYYVMNKAQLKEIFLGQLWFVYYYDGLGTTTSDTAIG